MDEVSDGPLYRDRVGGIGIGRAGMTAAIRVPPGDRGPGAADAGGPGVRDHQAGVLVLAGWLWCWPVPAVVTEAARGITGKGAVLPAGGGGARVRAR